MVQMNKKEFKKAVRNAVKTHGQAIFDAKCLTQSSASGVRKLYASHVNSVVQYSQAQHYLNVGACTKGKLLLLQLRMGSLPVRGNVHVLLQHGAPTTCPACQHDDETTKHFLVECATTQSARANMLNKLQQTDPDLAQRLFLEDTDALYWALLSSNWSAAAVKAIQDFLVVAWRARDTTAVEDGAEDGGADDLG